MNIESYPPVRHSGGLLADDYDSGSAEPDGYGYGYGSGGFEIDFRALWVIFRRNLLLILAIILASVAVGAIATMLATPRYVATASVQIDQEAAQVLDSSQGVEPATSFQDADRFLQTQLDVLNSRAMAVRVGQALNLFGDTKFLDAMGVRPPEAKAGVPRDQQLRDAVVDVIVTNLTASLRGGSRVATVSFESPSPQMAAKVAESYVSEFIKNNLQRKFDSTAYARNFLQQQLVEAKGRLEQSERDLNDYSRQAGLIKTSPTASDAGGGLGSGSVTTASLVQLNQAANAATAQRIAIEEKWRVTKGAPLLSLPDVLGNKAIQDLLQQRATTDALLSDELSKHLEGYPTVVQLRARLSETNNQINTIATSIKQSVYQQYEAARQLEQSLQSQVGGLKNETLTEQDRGVRYNILAREADTNRTLYEGLLQRFKEVSASAGITASNISVVDQAATPTSPSSPKLFLNLALALLAGVALAGGVVFIREQLDDAIRSPDDIERKLGISTLGVIPVAESSELYEDLLNPRSAVAEAYNSLRTALLYSTADGLPPVLHVTSTQPGEGKSTTSYALAMGFAKLGKKVVLVDADLRRPTLHQIFGIANEHGLTNLLTASSDVTSVMHATDVEHLSLITSGPIPPSPAELLGHPRLLEALGQLRAMFDVVVIDAPPVLGLADSPLLASIIGNSIFVVEANHGHRGSARSAIKRLQTGHNRILGAVLTKFDPRKTSAGYGYYGYDYYRYGDGNKQD